MYALILYALSFLLGLSLTVFAVAVTLAAISPVVSAKPYLYSFGGGILAGLVVLAIAVAYMHYTDF